MQINQKTDIVLDSTNCLHVSWPTGWEPVIYSNVLHSLKSLPQKQGFWKSWNRFALLSWTHVSCVANASCMQSVFFLALWSLRTLMYKLLLTQVRKEKRGFFQIQKRLSLYTHSYTKTNVRKATLQQGRANKSQSIHELKTFRASVYGVKCPGIHTVSFFFLLMFGT